MSTTKDKQGPYNYRWSDPNWIVYGPSRPIYLSSEELCILECERLNAAYQAGQADRDELVKALRPFAQCACSPEGECRCYNCIARDTINRTNP